MKKKELVSIILTIEYIVRWVLGETPYCFLSDGRFVATYKAEDSTRLIAGTRNKKGDDNDGDALYDIVKFGRYVTFTSRMEKERVHLNSLLF